MASTDTEFKRPLRINEQGEAVSDSEASIDTLLARFLRQKKSSACCEWIRSACIDRFINESVARTVLNGAELPQEVVRAAAEAGLDISDDTES